MSTFNQKFAQLQPFSLSGAGAVIGATTIILQSMTDIDGNALSMSGTFGTKGRGTLEPGNGALEEQIVFTGLTNNTNGTVTLTGVSNVLFVYPYTESSGLAKTHAGSTSFVISNTSGFYAQLASTDDDEVITGQWQFPNDANTPTLGASYVAPTLQNQVASKGYADAIALAGAPNATTSVQGMVQLPTQAQVDAGTATGSTGASLTPTPTLLRSKLLSDYVVDTGAANAYVITPSPAISAYATGQQFTFKAVHTNTTASTLAVNGLTATAIKKLDGATALVAGDITSGQIITVEYDGTNFQMLNPAGQSLPSGSISMYGGASAPGGWLLCDGTSYLRATYPALFTAISTTFGSADGTHFNVPDLRGRAPIGAGTGTGGGASGTGVITGGNALTARTLSAWVGEETHVQSLGELAAHTHGATAGNSGGGTTPLAAGGSSGTYVTASTGSSTAANIMQPILTLNFIIRT